MTGRFPRFSPDGTRLAFWRAEDAGVYVSLANGDAFRVGWTGDPARYVRGTRPEWLDDGHVVFGDADGPGLHLVDAADGRVAETVPIAVNGLSAGGGRWAAWSAPGTIRRNFGPDVVNAYLPALSATGSFAFARFPAAPSQTLVTEAGEIVDVGGIRDPRVYPGAIVYGRPGVFGKWSVFGWRGHGPEFLNVTEDLYELVVGLVQGPSDWWVATLQDVRGVDRSRLILRPWGGTHGVVVEDGETFEPDVASMPGDAGHAQLAWKGGAGEIIVRAVAFGTTTDLRQEGAPPPPVVEPFDRPLDAGYFFASSDRHGDNPDAPETITVVVEPGAVTRARRPMILGAYEREDGTHHWSDMLRPAKRRWKRVRALLVGGATADECEAAIVRARRAVRRRGLRPRPVIGYLDVAEPDRIPRCDIVGLQCYPEFAPDERLESLRARVLAQLARVPSRRSVALICGAYDRNGRYDDIDELARIQSLWPELARADRRVRYLLFFSDGRPGGTRDLPMLRPWHAATVAAISGRR